MARAVELAALMDGHLTGAVGAPHLAQPVSFHPFGKDGAADLARRQTGVDTAAAELVARFRAIAGKAGIGHAAVTQQIEEGGAADAVVATARLYDLAVLATGRTDEDHDHEVARALMFDAGRPLVLMPAQDGALSLDRIVVAWDFGRAAARALADAMPLLRRAASVELVVVTSDKDMPGADGAETLIANLARGGVRARLREVDRGSGSVGEAIDAAAEGAGMLVMGAFGHSRMRDLVLGGATLHVLKNTRRPTLLSH